MNEAPDEIGKQLWVFFCGHELDVETIGAFAVTMHPLQGFVDGDSYSPFTGAVINGDCRLDA